MLARKSEMPPSFPSKTPATGPLHFSPRIITIDVVGHLTYVTPPEW